MNRRRWLALTAGWTACKTASPGSERTAVRVAVHPSLAAAPFFAAGEQGLFDDAGFDVETVQVRNTATLTALLAAGEIDAAFMALVPGFISAVAQGAQVRLVAGRDIVVPECSLIGRLYGRREVFPEGLRDLGVLRGKRIAITRKAGVAEFYLDMHLAQAGLSSDDVEIATLRYQEAQAAFIAGHVDAVISSLLEHDLTFDPAAVVAGQGLGDILPNTQVNFVLYGSRLLEGDVEAGARLLAAYLDGAAAYRAGFRPQAIVEWAKETNVRPEVLTTSICEGGFAEDGAVDMDSVRLMQKWARDKGYADYEIDAEALVDGRFVEAARAYRRHART